MNDDDTYFQEHFALIPVWISELGAHAIVVYFALAAFARYEGERECYPSVAKLQKLSGLSERTVRATLKTLCAAGAIVSEPRLRENGSQASNLYRLRIDRPEGGAPDAPPRPAGHAPLEREDSIQPGPDLPSESGRVRVRVRAGEVGVGTVVLGAKVTVAEYEKATLVLADFNRMAGMSVTLKPREHLRLLVGRIRENPELELSDFGRIIEANLAEPWWDGRPSLNVIFSPKVFSIAAERGKEWGGSNGARPARRGRGQQTLEDLVAMADRFDREDAEAES